MPEGHSIRILANKWGKLVGKSMELSSPQGRFSDEAAKLSDRTLEATHAHGKHLFLEFTGKAYIHIHLGLYGRFRWQADSRDPPVGAVRLRAEWGTGAVNLIGPTKCELLDEAGKNAIHARLGVDPLHAADEITPLLPWLKTSSWPIGKTLMEQSKIAGVGNVYRAEILFMLAINPWRLNSDLSSQEWKAVWKLSRELLQGGVRHNGIVTTAKELPPPLTLPPGTACASRTYVYKQTKKPCVACGTPIRAKQFYSRMLYWCPTCQAPKPGEKFELAD